MRRAVAILGIWAISLAGCSIDVGEVRVGPMPACTGTGRGTLVLMAQAVPSAGLIPCLERLPDGWVLERVDIESGEAELTFDNSGIGDVVVTLRPQCDRLGESVASGTPGAEEFFRSQNETDIRQVVFSGGCVEIESPRRLAASEVTEEIFFVSRQELAEASDLEL